MRRWREAVALVCVLAALTPLACNAGGVAGPGGFCDPDVLAPEGTSGSFRQYQKDWDRCRAGGMFRGPFP